MSSTINLPKITLNIIGTAELASTTEHKVLFVGQKTSDGSAVSGELQQSVLGVTDIEARFGKRSMLSQMMRAARRENTETQFDAIALTDNGAGVKATASIAFTGPATADGRLTFEIASGKDRVYDLDITSGQTANQIATALFTLLNADTKAPFTVVDGTGTVNLTAANAGTVGNGMLLRYTGAVAGVGVTLTAFSGGATNPSLTGLFDVIDNIRYQTIVWPNVFTVSVLTDLLDPRVNATNNVLDGVGIVCKTDTLANLKTYATTENSKSLYVSANNAVSTTSYKGATLREMDDVIAAEFAALRSLRLTDGANLANAVTTTTGERDLFGGPSLATLPYFNTPMDNIPVPVAGTFWSDLERSELEDAGVSVIGPNRARSGVVVGEALTTNTKDSGGNPDDSFKFLNTFDASSVTREFFYNNLKDRYSQSRLTNGDILPGRAMENEQTIRAFCVRLYKALADIGVCQAGDDALRRYTDSLVVTVTLTVGNGLVVITQAPPLVGQLREIQGTIRVSFGNE